MSASDNDDDFEDIGDDYESEDYEDEYDSDDDCEPTALESYDTVLDNDKTDVDEFALFCNSLMYIRNNDVNWYQILLSSVDTNQQKKLVEFGEFANRRAAEAESKRLEKQGGYEFVNQNVPTNFNFGK